MPPPPPGEPVAAAPAAPAVDPTDPHQLGVAAARLGGPSKRAATVALTVASALLDEGELAEAVVQGQFAGHPGVAVLTHRRVLLVNDASLAATVEAVPLGAGLTVQGWQDDQVASLTFQDGDRQVTIDTIVDRPLAQDMAGKVRAKVAALS